MQEKKKNFLAIFLSIFFLQNREKEFRILLTEDLVSSKSGWLDVFLNNQSKDRCGSLSSTEKLEQFVI
jgi:hypothetical protein